MVHLLQEQTTPLTLLFKIQWCWWILISRRYHVTKHLHPCPSVPQMSLVDLGKRLLEAARKGQDDEVRNLMANGAPFTTDWVRKALCSALLSL